VSELATSPPTRRPTPGPTTTTEPCDNLWHVSIETGEKGTCTNSLNYPKAWELNDLLKAKMLLATSDQCCNGNFPGQKCNVVNVCGDGTPVDAPPANGSSGGCTNPWHISTSGASNTCTNDDDYPASWNMEKIRVNQLHDTAEICCKKFFADEVCHQINVCGDTVTTTSSGFYPVFKWPGCTNDDQAPAYIKAQPKDFYFKSIEACCASGNFDIKDYDICMEKSVEVTQTYATAPATPITNPVPTPATAPNSNPTPATAPSSDVPPGNCSNPWHISTTGASNTCTNDEKFPAAWKNNENIRPNTLFDTFEACCNKFFPGKECNKVDACPPDTSGSVSTETTTTSTAAASAMVTSTTSTTTTKKMLLLDWENGTIEPGLVRFEGIGEWMIDESQPCCRTGNAIHNPILLPGEYSSMVIDYDITLKNGKIKFNYNMGLGSFQFSIDGVEKLSVVVPGGGSKTFEASLGTGKHSFTWKFEPPGNSQLPLAHVWIDNIEMIG
jgi:hypothetical protein